MLKFEKLPDRYRIIQTIMGFTRTDIQFSDYTLDLSKSCCYKVDANGQRKSGEEVALDSWIWFATDLAKREWFEKNYRQKFEELENFYKSYVEAALWASPSCDDGEHFGTHQLADETKKSMRKDSESFVNTHFKIIEYAVTHSEYGNFAQAGHDFWLTRCEHGCGFWDGDWDEPEASILDKASKAAGSVDLYVGDDGLIYN